MPEIKEITASIRPEMHTGSLLYILFGLLDNGVGYSAAQVFSQPVEDRLNYDALTTTLQCCMNLLLSTNNKVYRSDCKYYKRIEFDKEIHVPWPFNKCKTTEYEFIVNKTKIIIHIGKE